MREIFIRNLTSEDHLKRDCLIKERMSQGEYTTHVTRRCTYRVESQTVLPATQDAIQWAKTLDPVQARQVFVTKTVDPETGRERVVYKVLGHFYVVMKRSVFCVGYRHILSMDIEGEAEALFEE